MNDNAKKWVAALRSGEYCQGKEMLRTPDNEFCCLGVACDLYAKECAGCRWEDRADGGQVFVDNHNRQEVGELTETVRDWLGMNDCSGYFDGIHGPSLSESSLAGLNDNGSIFAELADLIESEPPGLFQESAA